MFVLQDAEREREKAVPEKVPHRLLLCVGVLPWRVYLTQTPTSVF